MAQKAQRDLAQRIHDAVAATGEAAPLSEKHIQTVGENDILLPGTLPLHMRHLVALLTEYGAKAVEAHGVWRDTPDDSDEEAVAKAAFENAKRDHDVIKEVFFTSLRDHYDFDGYDGIKLVAGWRVAGFTLHPAAAFARMLGLDPAAVTAVQMDTERNSAEIG